MPWGWQSMNWKSPGPAGSPQGMKAQALLSDAAVLSWVRKGGAGRWGTTEAGGPLLRCGDTATRPAPLLSSWCPGASHFPGPQVSSATKPGGSEAAVEESEPEKCECQAGLQKRSLVRVILLPTPTKRPGACGEPPGARQGSSSPHLPQSTQPPPLQLVFPDPPGPASQHTSPLTSDEHPTPKAAARRAGWGGWGVVVGV